MKKIKIFVHHAAELDAFGYFQHIQEHNPDAAAPFLEAIDATVQGLALQTQRGA